MILALKALAVLVMTFLLMALAMFLPAGTLLWPAGWIEYVSGAFSIFQRGYKA